MTDPWIPFMVWCAAIAGLWIVCVLANRARLKMCEWWDNRRERRARKAESDAYGTDQVARLQHLNSMARAIRSEDRRELSARVKSDMDRRRDQVFNAAVADSLKLNWATQSNPHPQRTSNGALKGRVTASEVGGHTRLTYTPKDAA